MKLKKLQIHKFKGTGRTIELTGRDIFLGRSGSGKTAIVQAIGFAHHGFDPMHLISRRQLADTFQDYAPGGDEVSVGLEFSDPDLSFTRSIVSRPGRVGKTTFSESIKIVGDDSNTTEAHGKIVAALGSSIAAYTLGSFLSKSGDEQMREAMEILVASGTVSDPRTFVINSALESHLGEEVCKTIRQFVENPTAQQYRDAISKRGEQNWLAGFDLVCGRLSSNQNPILCIQDSLRDLKEFATDHRANKRSSEGAIQELVGQRESALGAAVAGGRETLESSKQQLEAQRSEVVRQIEQAKAVIDQAAKTQEEIRQIDLKIAPLDPAPLAREPEEVEKEMKPEFVSAANEGLQRLIGEMRGRRATLTEVASAAAAANAVAMGDLANANLLIQNMMVEKTSDSQPPITQSNRTREQLAEDLRSLAGQYDSARDAAQRDLAELNAKIRDTEIAIGRESDSLGIDRQGVANIALALERFASGKCPECLSTIDITTNERVAGLMVSKSEIAARIADRESAITLLQNTVAELRTSIEACGTGLGDLATKIKATRYELAHATGLAAETAKADAEQRLAAATQAEQAANQELTTLDAAVSESKEQKYFDESVAKLEALRAELSALQVRKEQLGRLADLQGSRQRLVDSIPNPLPDTAPLEANEKELAEAIRGIDLRLKKFDEMRGVDRQIESAREKMLKAERVLDAVDALTEGLRKLRKQVLEEPLGRMEECVTRVYSAVFPGWSAFFRVIEGTRPALEFGVTDGIAIRRYAGMSTGELLALLAGVQFEFVSRCPWKLICLEQVSDHLDADSAASLLKIVGEIAGPDVQIIATGHNHAFGAAPDGWKVVELT